MTFEYLKHAAWMLQRRIDVRRVRMIELRALRSAGLMTLPLAGGGMHLHSFVLPGIGIVLAFLRIESGEKTVEVLRIPEVAVNDGRRVGVV